jgi:hypothetical protein
MAVTVGLYAALGDEIPLGGPGRQLLLSFSAALVFAGLLLAGLGITLLHDARHRGESYLVPFAGGLVMGGLEAVFLVELVGGLVWLLPFLLVIPALRPVRRRLFAPFYGGGRKAARGRSR